MVRRVQRGNLKVSISGNKYLNDDRSPDSNFRVPRSTLSPLLLLSSMPNQHKSLRASCPSLLFSHHSLDNLHIAPLHLAEPHIRRYLSAEATPASVTAASPMRLCPNTNARGLTTIVVEQVFHHPPITAYYIANPSRGVTLEGRNAQKTFFSGKVALSAAWCPRLKHAHSQVAISL